jgi:hypothetical protein
LGPAAPHCLDDCDLRGAGGRGRARRRKGPTAERARGTARAAGPSQPPNPARLRRSQCRVAAPTEARGARGGAGGSRLGCLPGAHSPSRRHRLCAGAP